jgi:glutathione S-transferase
MPSYSLVLGNKAYSTWSLRAWLGARLAGIDFDEVVIPLNRPETREAILEHSPSGQVPVLQADGIKIWESLAILDYLARKHPGSGLWPEDEAALAHALSISAEMHAGFASLRRDMPMDLKRDRPGEGRTPETMIDIARITTLWRRCREQYGQGGPFLFGSRPGIADAMYAPVVMRFRGYKVQLDPACRAYADAIVALPAMQDWIAAAQAERWVIEDL